MTARYKPLQRILTIDPFRHGFGWAVLEGDDLLIDWGICQVRTKKSERVIARVAALIHRYAPHAVVLEKTADRLCLRKERARNLIREISAMARAAGIPVARVSSRAVRGYYATLGAGNKDDIARCIVELFPELERVLPTRRKNWTREDERMTVFDAIAMALTASSPST